MNQEIAIRTPTNIIPGGPIRALVPQDYDQAFNMAQKFHDSRLMPYGLDTPEKVCLVIMAGMEVGLPPVAALNSFAVIGGRACIYGDAVPGIVEASGLLMDKEEWFEGTPPEPVEETDPKTGEIKRVIRWHNDYTAHCRVTRKGGRKPVESKFSVLDAKVALLWMKVSPQGKTTPWITNPPRMLMWRARHFALRDAFPDVTKGIPSAEEMQDVQDYQAAPVPLAPPITEPPVPPEPDAPDEPLADLQASQVDEGTVGAAGPSTVPAPDDQPAATPITIDYNPQEAVEIFEMAVHDAETLAQVTLAFDDLRPFKKHIQSPDEWKRLVKLADEKAQLLEFPPEPLPAENVEEDPPEVPWEPEGPAYAPPVPPPPPWVPPAEEKPQVSSGKPETKPITEEQRQVAFKRGLLAKGASRLRTDVPPQFAFHPEMQAAWEAGYDSHSSG